MRRRSSDDLAGAANQQVMVDGMPVRKLTVPPLFDPEPGIREFRRGPDFTLAVDRWTRFLGEGELREGASFMGALARHPGAMWAGLVREVFGQLVDPFSTPIEAQTPDAQWVATARETAADLPDFQRLAGRCGGDPMKAGLVTHAVCEVLAQYPPPPPVDGLQHLAELKQQAAAEQPTVDRLRAAAEATRQAAEAAQQQAGLCQQLIQDGPKLRQQLRRAMQGAETELEQVEAAEEAAQHLAGTTAGQLHQKAGPATDLLRLLRKDKHLATVVARAGRLRATARRTRKTKTLDVPQEIVDVELGGEWARLVAAEMGCLADPHLELQLTRRVLERGALQYRMEGEEELDRGPIVLCVDESGSMKGARHEYAAAVALVLLETAVRERRDFALVHFDARVQRVDHFTPGRIDMTKLADALGYFAGGGTCFDAPLQRAVEIVGADARYQKADIVIVTDGESEVQPATAAALRASDARLHAVSIQCPIRDDLRELTDTVAHLSSVTGDGEELAALWAI